MKRRAFPTIASSNGEITEENTGVTVRIDPFASHSCEAAHVAFGRLAESPKATTINKNRSRCLAGILQEHEKSEVFSLFDV